MKFIDLGLSPEIISSIEKLGFETPTPVQEKVIPFLLDSDQDLVALAQTGTGKTAAFGLPILEHLDLDSYTPQALVLCPTRELCVQIARDLDSFTSGFDGVRILAVYGGSDIRKQLDALKRGVQIVVATPGRMLDILKRRKVDFSFVERVVLDEADEMLNMGFQEELEGVLSKVPDLAQTLLFSATMPKDVAKIARSYMENPHEITVGLRNMGAENVNHEYYVVHAKDRYRALRRVVDSSPRIYGIIFCRTRMETQQVADHLRKDGYNAEPLHGDLSQPQRDSVMKKFRDHHVQLLVATDVAARGIDVNDLTHVINYQLPDDPASYTHRSGRTGRAGKDGTSVSIIHMRERSKISRIEKVLGKKFTKCPIPTGEQIAHIRLMATGERVRDWESGASLIDPYLEEMTAMLSDLSKEELIKRFISIDLHRLLLFYRDAPDLNAEPSERDSGAKKNKKQKQHGGGVIELVMNVGKLNGLTPKKLMSMVNVADRESSIEIGRINVAKMQAYFEVPKNDAKNVVESFEQAHIDCKGRRVSVSYAGTSKRGSGKAKSRKNNRPKKRNPSKKQ